MHAGVIAAALWVCGVLPVLQSSSPATQLATQPPQATADSACRQAFAGKQYAAAADCFARVAAAATLANSSPADALLMEAKSRLHLDDLPHAETALRASIKANPQSPEALYLLGSVLERRGNAKESLGALTKAAALQAPTGEQLRIAGLDYVLLGSYRDAIHWLGRSVELNPANAEAWYDLGRAQMHEGRFAEATAALRRSLALEPHSAKAEDNVGVCLEAQNQPEAALAAYSRAVAVANTEQHPSEQPFVDYGALLNTRNGFQAALPLLERATQLNPKNSRAFAELSRACSGVGEKDRARSAMEQAVTLDPGNSRLHFQLGRLYRAAGMQAQAQHEFDLSSHLYGQKSAE